MHSPSHLRAIRWFLWLTLLHTVPAPFFLFVVAGTVPAAGLLVSGVAGLFGLDREGLMMGLVLGGQGLAYAGIFFLVAWVLAALLVRIRSVPLRSGVLVALAGAAMMLALQPVFVIGGHGGEHWHNLPGLLEGFRIPALAAQVYAGVVLALLGLLLVLQGLDERAWMARLPSSWTVLGIVLLALLAGSLWMHRVMLFCAPAANAEYVWGQLCVARAARAQAEDAGRVAAPDAVEWYRRAARQGSIEAMRELLEISRDPDDRREWLPVLAAQGDPGAIADYWALLNRTGGTTEELAQARAWLVDAADRGHAGAAVALARDLLAREEWDAARERFDQAADLGDIEAMRELAWRYQQGAPGFPIDLERALALYERLSDPALAEGPDGTHRRHNVAGYVERAATLRKLLDGVQSGDAEAQLQLARRILDSNHRDEAGEARVLELLEQAGEQGLVEAQHQLGELLVLGYRGFPKDIARGRKWWNRAAAQEHVPTLRFVSEARTSGRHGYDIDFGQAQREFAILVEAYTEGTRGVKADARQAAHWQSALRDAERKRAALGDDYVPVAALRERAAGEDADAQYQLGVQLVQAYSADAHQEAVDWWIRAAANGHAEAQFRLVSYYLRGDRFVNKDIAEAVRLLQAAAASHHPRALFELGLVYEKGRHGVKRDLQRAGEIYREIVATKDGNPYGWDVEERYYRMVENRVKAVERMQGMDAGG